MTLKWIQDIDGTWHLKNTEFETVSKAEKIEDKINMLREVVNYLLEVYGKTNQNL